MKSAFLLFLSLCLAGDAYASPDKELVRLRSALMHAQTQTDLNLRSGELAQYLDRMVTTLEERIKQDLDRDTLALFITAAERWRDYRTAQTKAEGNLYQGKVSRKCGPEKSLKS